MNTTTTKPTPENRGMLTTDHLAEAAEAEYDAMQTHADRWGLDIDSGMFRSLWAIQVQVWGVLERLGELAAMRCPHCDHDADEHREQTHEDSWGRDFEYLACPPERLWGHRVELEHWLATGCADLWPNTRVDQGSEVRWCDSCGEDLPKERLVSLVQGR